ncbi:MAG: glycosyltransferase [Roseicyclus sp.]
MAGTRPRRHGWTGAAKGVVQMTPRDVPKVSVLMGAYNAERFLREALDDLLAQTMADFELVVVDDGSTDATSSILEDYARRDGRIVLLRNGRNLGLPASLNRGLARCRADIVARADADDRYMPDRLARQLAFLEAHPEVGLMSCAVEKIDEQGRSLFVNRFPTKDGEIRMRELFVNCFSHPGVMFRRRLVEEVGGYDETLLSSQDADLWQRLRRRTVAANLDAPLVRYRKHTAQNTADRSPEDREKSLAIRRRALEDYLAREVPMKEAGAMVETFHCRNDRRADPDALQAGMRGLREVLACARRRESAETRRYFRTVVHDALLGHARQQVSDPPLRRRLIAEAIRWRPARSARRAGARLVPGIGV